VGVGLEKRVYVRKDVGEGEDMREDVRIGCGDVGEVGVEGYLKAPWGMAGGGVGVEDCGYG